MSDQEDVIQNEAADSTKSSSALPTSPKGEDNIEMTKGELLNNWKRTTADFENYRKRKEGEGTEMMQFAKEITVAKLMPSLQNLEQVLKYAPADEKYKDWMAGLRGTIMQLEKDMEELGVKRIKTVGEQFDPQRHEAVEEVEGEPGKVVREIQPGFMLNDKAIIPAKVAVGKQDAQQAESEKSNTGVGESNY